MFLIQTDQLSPSALFILAPGAFITSLNHYLKSRKSELDWKWFASTLNPYYEGNNTLQMINDDRFILPTLDNWTFGLDNTGNILEPLNLKHLIEQFQQSIDLVTADGSIDCQTDPARQEELVGKLHMAETISALGTLKVGGHFVIK